VDNLTHTLVGACLAEAGLKRRTTLGAATLMIGANFPDIDVIAVPLGMGIEWRRGATHGFLALLLLPFVLAEIMSLWDKRVRRRRDPALKPAVYRQLLILSAISIATHPTLDFMNTYGMRWLMPFANRWFYADGLYIVDLWILIALAVGMVWSRREKTTRPARIALVGVAAYATLMLMVTEVGRDRAAAIYPGQRIMVEPNGAVPWRRNVLIEDDLGYRMANWSLFGRLEMLPMGWPKGDKDPRVVEAKRNLKVRAFLRWARFPMYQVSREGGRTVVWIGDARYEGAGWASVKVALP
jgi:inner membrane protein